MPVATSSVTGFGLRLLGQLGAGPVAFSPLSVHGCLATLREGASGLGAMFRDGADFDGMFTGPAPAKGAGRVLHRARVDLDEEGTRAAAVTVITMRATGMPADPPDPFDLRLDRPFLWAIEHRESGTLLFLGRVTDPSTT